MRYPHKVSSHYTKTSKKVGLESLSRIGVQLRMRNTSDVTPSLVTTIK